jgi:hypothetical protein
MPFRRLIQKRLNKSGTAWDDKEIYMEGDIVTYNNILYYNITDYNQGNNPRESTHLWNRLESKNVPEQAGIFAFAKLDGQNNIIKSDNIENITFNNNWTYIWFPDGSKTWKLAYNIFPTPKNGNEDCVYYSSTSGTGTGDSSEKQYIKVQMGTNFNNPNSNYQNFQILIYKLS